MRIAVYWKQHSWGGVDIHLLNLLKNWPNEKDKFTIIHNEGNQGVKHIIDELTEIKAVSFVSFKSIFDYQKKKILRLLLYFAKPILFWISVHQAKSLFSKYGPFDVVLSDSGGYPVYECISAIIAASKLEIPKRMLYIHYAPPKPPVLMETFEWLIDRMLCKYATDIVANSLATRKTLVDRRWFSTELNPIRVIYPGVDISSNEMENPHHILRKKFSLGDSLLIGMMGRVERYKGHEDLIIGFSLLPKKYRSNLKLVFIGSGEEQEIHRLDKLAQNLCVEKSVVFTGYIPGNPLASISQLDLLAGINKDFEGFGLTIAEAMAVGVPIMATRVGAIPEFVNEQIGTLVNPESPDEITEALKCFVDNRELFRKKSVLAKKAIKRYGIKEMALKFSMLFSS